MFELLSLFLPQEASVLVLVGIGFAVMFRLRRLAVGLTGLLAWMVLGSLFDPLIDAVFSMLPLWAVLPIGVLFVVWVVRTVLQTILGREGAGHVVGHLAIGFVRGLFRLSLLPLRLLVRALT